MTTVRTKRALQRSRIIERPRLLAVLDGSEARVRALVAAAGYGKTTLAEQWVNRAERRHAWYTARSASADVAALALGLARSASTIVHDSEVRLREHLRAVSAAAERTSVLAEILSEDLAAWPGDAWLVIDDYQEFAGAAEAEGFVAELVASCPVQILITSRQRPSWMTARSILYGEVLEINQAALAMNNQEAAEVLTDWSLPSASGLVALANGWPAVIGLASVSAAEIDGDVAVPESLYSFFAEEVFAALGDEIREGLSLLAVAPVIDRELAHALLGERADSICEAAIEVGILVEREDRLDLHPLARAFLEERVPTPPRDAIDTCLAHYRRRRDWDAAFDLIVRCDISDELQGLLTAALDDLLKAARLSTIEAWCDHAIRCGRNEAVFALARAETALRQERYSKAKAYAEAAASEPVLSFRALSLAGRVAHLASRETEALELYRRAEAVSRTAHERREARWGQVLCAVELDLPETASMLDEATAGVDPSDPVAFIRATTCRLSFEMRFHKVALNDGDLAWELLSAVEDPLIRTAFESIYANGLALGARYRDALNVATDLLDTAEKHRLDFARPYGLVAAGMAHAGMRQWSAAHGFLAEADTVARSSGNLYAELFALAARLSTFAQQGLYRRALALSVPDLEAAIPAIRADVLASRALALVAAGRADDAMRCLESIGTVRTTESTVLRDAVELAVEIKQGKRLSRSQIASFEESAFVSGALGPLIAAYRAVPELLVVVFRTDPSRRWVDLLCAAGDEDLLEPLNFAKSDDDPRRLLTPREREVYELLCRSLTNRQIAELLVISESTAKLHVQRIFNKLGIHSRNALAIQAALERSDQATSAMR